MHIEHMMRTAEKKIKMMQDAHVSGLREVKPVK
jgi:hypothetical protein